MAKLPKKTQAVSVFDPLRQYLAEVQRIPLLEPEEEHSLATEFRKTGSPELAKRLVTANLRLVVKIALEYRSYYTNLMDLIQEGNVGLMKAVAKFDPTKGAKLSYYSAWWIRSYILKHILDNFRLVKVGTTQAQRKLFYHLMREKEKLEAQGLLAGPKLLAEKLDVSEKDVIEMSQRLSSRGGEAHENFDESNADGAPSKGLLSRIPDEREGADTQMEAAELSHILKETLPDFEKTLNEKEKKVLQSRLLAENPKTLQEVADLYGLSRERVRQIEAAIIKKLKNFMGRAIDV